MSDSAKLHLCYGIILFILSFLCLAGFVSSVWLAVLINSDFTVLALFTAIGTIISSAYCVRQLLKAGRYITLKAGK